MAKFDPLPPPHLSKIVTIMETPSRKRHYKDLTPLPLLQKKNKKKILRKFSKLQRDVTVWRPTPLPTSQAVTFLPTPSLPLCVTSFMEAPKGQKRITSDLTFPMSLVATRHFYLQPICIGFPPFYPSRLT
jgi:hypothetical protein